jgi:branched-chain amino acid transport system substrate-binding protein
MIGISRRAFAQAAAMQGIMALVGGGSSPTLAEDAATIKLGLTTALTGPYNEFGEGNKRGFDLAIELCNAGGGIGGRQRRDRHGAGRSDGARPGGPEHAAPAR